MVHVGKEIFNGNPPGMDLCAATALFHTMCCTGITSYVFTLCDGVATDSADMERPLMVDPSYLVERQLDGAVLASVLRIGGPVRQSHRVI